MIFQACSHKKEATIVKKVYYTCSMHPEIVQGHPGKCPICAMELIAVIKSESKGTDEISLSDQQMQLGNIRVDTIIQAPFSNEKLRSATVVADERNVNTVSSKIAGRVDKLYFKNSGDYIRKGAPLMEIYSEELNNQKQQYLLMLEKEKTFPNTTIDFRGLVHSAKMKLSLLGMSEGQLKQMERSRRSSYNTTVFSTASGFITTLDILEGSYVSAGSPVVHLTDLSSVWVEAQLYASELKDVDRNETVKVTFPSLPGKEIKGKIDFTSPEIQSQTRTNLIRVNIPNSSNAIKPGMAANVTFITQFSNAMTLPADAIIQDIRGASVWIRTTNNTFKNRSVSIGITSNGRIAIKSGLSQGDIVVTSGAYLINSEYVFKKGASPMGGMDMGKMKM